MLVFINEPEILCPYINTYEKRKNFISISVMRGILFIMKDKEIDKLIKAEAKRQHQGTDGVHGFPIAINGKRLA